jgi:hypothetical protein
MRVPLRNAAVDGVRDPATKRDDGLGVWHQAVLIAMTTNDALSLF